MSLDKEILDGFIEESTQQLNQLEIIVERLEEVREQFPSELLSEFARAIDGMMGTSKILLVDAPGHKALTRITTVAEICKKLGNEASSLNKLEFIPIFAAFWADTIEVMRGQLEELKIISDSDVQNQSVPFADALEKRLSWLFRQIAPAAGQKAMSQDDVNALLRGLGV